MIPSRRTAFYELFKASDIVFLFCSFWLACSLTRLDLHSEAHARLETSVPALMIASGALYLGWLFSLRTAGLYHSHRRLGLATVLQEVAIGCALSTLFVFCWLAVLRHLLRIDMTACFATAALFQVFSSVCLCISRAVMRRAVIWLRARGRNLRSVLIVGSSDRATGYARQLAEHQAWGYRVLGFIDDHWHATQPSRWGPQQLLTDLAGLPQLLRTLAVDEVLVALPLNSFYKEAAALTVLCKEHGIPVTLLGAFLEERGLESSPPQTTAHMVPVYESASEIGLSLWKRAIDIAVSLALLIVLSPALVVISALIVVLTSPGPALFKQTRLGCGKHPFTIYKFRTMRTDAEKELESLAVLNETGGPTFKASRDPRITALGHILRKTSLDELPQLFNVLLGDMSLVGPRPLPIRDYEGFSKDWHRRRFSVKPGITCLWQVMGRSVIGFEEWMTLDMRYIDEWSLLLDLKILFMTIPAVLRGSGAV